VNETVAFPPALQEATDRLIHALLGSGSFLAYQGSLAQLESDSQARGLLERLSMLQVALRGKQGAGQINQADIEELRAVQSKVRVHPAIIEYAQSQQGAADVLREVNQEIRQVLGMDFAALARSNTC